MTRPELKTFRRLLGYGALAAVVTLVVMVLLPHDRYIRWQALRTEAYARFGWIYERIHFDPTPTDVVFIGTSHTMNGVDAATVQQVMAADGVRDTDGRCLTATNFAIPNYGRNVAWTIAHELLSTRRTRMVVLETFENESRKPHPLFIYIADAKDVLGAPLLINLNYFYDIARLPLRQASLSFKSLFPGQFGLKSPFKITDYDGSTVDNTRVVNVGGVALTPSRDTTISPAELEKARRHELAIKNTHLLGRRFDALEYAFPLHYLNGILHLAARHQTPVVFLYLPGYGKPTAPTDPRPYVGHGDMLFAPDIFARKDVWWDVDHLNAKGAAIYSVRVGHMLSTRLPHGPIKGPCNFGYPARATLRPFHPPLP
jgi:hypothetical protein